LAKHDLDLADIAFWVVHPGGPRIIEAVGESLALPEAAVQPTWDAWQEHGNLSSTTVFFILQQIARTSPPSTGAIGMMIAFGPGVTCEMVLLRAAGWLSTGA
jgi:alkylresorcinol/alkylpyrone synthase